MAKPIHHITDEGAKAKMTGGEAVTIQYGPQGHREVFGPGEIPAYQSAASLFGAVSQPQAVNARHLHRKELDRAIETRDLLAQSWRAKR